MTGERPSVADIVEWIRREIAVIVDRPADRIDSGAKFTRLGLDSANGVHLLISLESWLDVELEPELIAEYPTIDALARHVSDLVARKRSP